jgi:hypothetical protein
MRAKTKLSFAIAIIMLFLIFIPFIRIDSNQSPYCTLHYHPECPIETFAPVPVSPIYYSVIAYYLGFGAYYGAHYGYGFLLGDQGIRIV